MQEIVLPVAIDEIILTLFFKALVRTAARGMFCRGRLSPLLPLKIHKHYCTHAGNLATCLLSSSSENARP
jgi:hypothetical protein